MSSPPTVVFESWANFYVILGSSAGALTGLMFVVVSLVPQVQRDANESAIDTYSTPNIVHFGAVMLIAALISAPWPSPVLPGYIIAAIGAAGIIYVSVVARRAARNTVYEPVLADWLWHVCAPMILYTALAATGILVVIRVGFAPFAVAGAVLTLLFVGIRNAWDSVVFLALAAKVSAD